MTFRSYGSVGHCVRKEYAVRNPKRPPLDSRDLTGRICGDPLPGRSALDKKRLAEPLPVIEIAEKTDIEW